MPSRVLLVDDSQLNQVLGQKMLSKLDCLVDIAGGGAEALDLVRARPYDIVFLDCEMPAPDGFATAAEMRRAEPQRARRPVIGVSARARDADRARCLAAGMDDCIARPLTVDALAAMLARWLPPPVVDPRRLAALAALNDGATLVGRVVARFVECAPADIARLEAAADARNADELSGAAHAMRGAAANIGLPELCARLKHIEERARDGDLEAAIAGARAVAGDVDRARAELDAYRRTLF